MLSKTRSRLADEHGFSLVEAIVALGVMFGALLTLAYTAAAGFTDVANARQRQAASALANKVLEQVRAVPFETVAKGLATADLAGDAAIVLCGTDHYFRACPAADPNAEKIRHATDLPEVVPIVPHVSTFGPPEHSTSYTVSSYVTEAKNVPVAGGVRVTVSVSWTSNRGVPGSLQAQTLIYRPSGSTDSSTAPQTGSSRPFFYGAGAASRGSVVVTPNAGVSAGVGVQGLVNWSSIAHDLYSLDSSVQQEQLVKADGQVTLIGGRKTEGAVESTTSGAKSVSVSDDDPATAAGTSSAPGQLTQTGSAATLTGNGNAIRAGGTGTLPPSCPPSVSTPTWLTGFESGVVTTSGGGLFDFGDLSTFGSITADSATKRNGAYSLRINRASSNGYSYVGKGVAGTTAVGRFAVRLDSLANAATFLARVHTGDGYDLRFGYSTIQSKFYMGIEGTATSNYQFSSITPSAQTWYLIDFRFRTGTTPRTIDWSFAGAPQAGVSVSLPAAATSAFSLGTLNPADLTFVARYDDVMITTSASDYPIGEGKVLRLVPDGLGTSSGLANFANNDGTAVGSTSWSRLDDVPMSSTADYIQQPSVSTTSHVGITFEDTVESCVRAASAVVAFRANGTKQSTGKTVGVHGGAETTVFDGSHASTTLLFASATIPGGATGWGTDQVNAFQMRIGYSGRTQSIPYWDSLIVEYASAPLSGGSSGSGPQSGYTGSSVPPSSPTYCYATQTQGACAYTQETHASTPPVYETEIDLTGSGAGDCNLYVNRPEATGKLSYAYGRRAWPLGGDGIVAEDVVRYYGAHQLAGLCSGTVSAAPAGWNGFYVQYDAGSAPSCAKSQAGVGASFPEVCHAGTITYWNGNGVSTLTPSNAGGDVPVAALDYTNNGWRYQISGNLAVQPSSVTQTPTDAPMFGLSNRTEARAVLGSPLTGTITYRVTKTATSEVVVDVTVNVDVGSLTALTRYRPAAT